MKIYYEYILYTYILGKTFRTLGTRAASIPIAGLTVAENIRKGENIADAVVDPLVGLELSFPGLFKEIVAFFLQTAFPF